MHIGHSRTPQRLAAAIAICALLSACEVEVPPPSHQSQADALPKTASVVQLCVTPERFDGLVVQTYGYLIIDENLRALCPGKTMLNPIECVELVGKDIPWSTIGDRPALIIGKFQQASNESRYAGALFFERGKASGVLEAAAGGDHVEPK